MKKLNTLLATTAVFAHKSHNLHWNVKGANFMVSHKMTDELYDGLIEFIDQIAEKIIMQNNKPLVTMQQFIEASEIKETEKNEFTAEEVADILLADLEIYCKLITETETDFYVQPLLDELIIFADKQRWFFRATSNK